LKHKDAR